MEQIMEIIPSWEETGRTIVAIVYLLGVMFIYSLAQASGRVGFFWAITAIVLTPVIALLLLLVLVRAQRYEASSLASADLAGRRTSCKYRCGNV